MNDEPLIHVENLNIIIPPSPPATGDLSRFDGPRTSGSTRREYQQPGGGVVNH